jgi:hypothetical protein
MAIASFNQSRRSQCFGGAIAGDRIGAQLEYLPRQTLEAVDTQAGLDELVRWLWKGQFPGIEFNDNFPTTGNAEIESVIRISNNVANRLRKLGIVGDPPEDGMGIEYGSHGLVKIGRIEKPF